MPTVAATEEAKAFVFSCVPWTLGTSEPRISMRGKLSLTPPPQS